MRRVGRIGVESGKGNFCPVKPNCGGAGGKRRAMTGLFDHPVRGIALLLHVSSLVFISHC